MLSGEYKKLEDVVGASLLLHDDLVSSIVEHLGKDKSNVMGALSKACIATGSRPADMAFCVNEFLISVREFDRESRGT